MSMVASDVGRIPAGDFSWYILFFEDAFDDPIKAEFSANFLVLAKEVGPKVLVVRGFDPEKFYESAYETLTLYNQEWHERITRPALLISDTVPSELLQVRSSLSKARLILIPLAPFRVKPSGSVVGLLRDLVAAVRDPDAAKALQGLEPGALEQKWGWLSKYAEVKPSFFGFGLNVNAAIAGVLSRKSKSS